MVVFWVYNCLQDVLHQPSFPARHGARSLSEILKLDGAAWADNPGSFDEPVWKRRLFN